MTKKVVQSLFEGRFLREADSPVVEVVARSIKEATQREKEACDEKQEIHDLCSYAPRPGEKGYPRLSSFHHGDRSCVLSRSLPVHCLCWCLELLPLSKNRLYVPILGR